jgi:ABC-type sugar transport system ATPase subunit
MAEIELRGVVKRFSEASLMASAGHAALDHIDLTIRDGETLAVVGPSGCGKSTLLKVVAGLEYPESGRVLYGGEDYTEIKPKDRGVGMVFQDYALYPTRKGEGNLKYYFEVRGAGQDEKVKRVREVAELMGVDFETLLGQDSSTLSGGQQQRVAIARCIVRDPKLFLMDEPIVNLDAKLRERTRLEMRKLLKKFRVTTLFVTHDQQEAVFMGDRIAVMREGKVVQLGTYDDLYYTPVDRFVAGFIGSPAMTFFSGTVQGGAFQSGNVRWEVPADFAPEGGDTVLGVRPESWRLGEGVEMPLRHTERLSSERTSILHGDLAGERVAVLTDLAYAGNSVRLTPDWDKTYLFDPHSGACTRSPEALELF